MEIHTDRLHLTRVSVDDAGEIRQLAGDEAVARTALHIPHPFEDGLAEAWIAGISPDDAVFAIRPAKKTLLLGLAGLVKDKGDDVAELSYWIGRAYWGRGYATEAASTVVAHGFEVMRLRRIYATVLAGNPASGSVRGKIGFQREGCLRRHVKHYGIYHDLLYYGLLHDEWAGLRKVKHGA